MVTKHQIIVIDDQSPDEVSAAIRMMARRANFTSTEMELGIDVATSGHDMTVIACGFESFARWAEETPLRAGFDVYRRKPWLRLQDAYESGKMRRKGRG